MRERLRVAVTGASGFVGGRIVVRLANSSRSRVLATSRRVVTDFPSNVETVSGLELTAGSVWDNALTGCDVVVHAAARVHVMNSNEAKSLEEFRRINVDGTLELAARASAAGVHRFIFISTIKVNGDSTDGRDPFRFDDLPMPVDAYAQSKLEAEIGLARLGIETGMDIIIVRPPIIYGPGVKANFARLMSLVRMGVPLPLGNVKNHRSMVYIDNLVDLVEECIYSSVAAGQILLVSDDHAPSTPDLIRLLAAAMGKPARLWGLPMPALALAGRITGRSAEFERLCNSLEVDTSRERELLSWYPPVSVEEGIRRTVDAFLHDSPRSR